MQVLLSYVLPAESMRVIFWSRVVLLPMARPGAPRSLAHRGCSGRPCVLAQQCTAGALQSLLR